MFELGRRPAAGSTRDYVYQLLRKIILNVKLEPGASISENEISDKLSVSRTPIREAFLRLAQEGLLEVFPQKGTFVSLIDLELVEEARFMREQVEKAVVRLACGHFPMEELFELDKIVKMQELCTRENDYTKLFELDEQFHQTIFAGCNKRRSWQALQSMKLDLDRIRMLRLATDYNWNGILEQHQAIVQSIRDHRPDEAERVMSEHLSLVIHDQDALKMKYPAYFK
ncbi:GntR family transcriptional regulator [Paenibacillus thalictri]|uniref:GntR family transcriptional regulator n=1 Tax=Paenibacillus thalictri TaxID=2527873 RepID=A0A4V2J4Q8_9BACL|nr:GntR family transcriptional regulator [Paenibacillus thalictri]TBL80742.1 GntR family transcriptional regulator [Paenibacillus thalictri]